MSTPGADLRTLAQQLVRIPTENPPGDEAAAAEFVHEWFTDRGLDATLFERPDPDRPQVAARIGSDEPTVVLNGHLDVVPVEDADAWSVDPYAGEVRDGRLYGRGSADMKTGLAIAMLVARDLAPDIRSDALTGSIVVHAAMGEETGDPGTTTLLEQGYDGAFGIVLEPTNFRAATSTKGQAVYRVVVRGEATHSSQPDAGTNAIDELRPVLEAIDKYDAELRERSGSLCGPAYATATAIEAGTDSNFSVIPDRGEIVLDRRVLPGESLSTVDEEITSLIDGVPDEHDLGADWTRLASYEPSSIPVDHPLATRLRDLSVNAVEADTDAGADVDLEELTEPWGIEAATDARNFVNDAGIPAVTWGPGDLGQAHTVDESISLADAATARTVLERALRELLS